jgi:hypothetical protein
MTCPSCKSENQNGKFCTSCGASISLEQKVSETISTSKTSYKVPKPNNIGKYFIFGIIALIGLSLIVSSAKLGQPSSLGDTKTDSSQSSKLDLNTLTKNTESVKVNFVKYLKYKINQSYNKYSLNGFNCAGLLMENGKISTVEHCSQSADANIKDREILLTANQSGERIDQILNDKYSVSPKYLSQDFVFPYKSIEPVPIKQDPIGVYYVFASDKIAEVKGSCIDQNCTLFQTEECKSEKCEVKQGQSGSPVFNSFGQYVGNLSYVINPTNCTSSDNYDYKVYVEEKELSISDFESSSKSYFDTVACSSKFAFSALNAPVNYSASKPRENDDKKYVEIFENFDNNLEYINLRYEPCGTILGKVNFGETGYSSGEVVNKECYGKNIKFQKITLDSGAIGYMAKENMRVVKNTSNLNVKYDVSNKCVTEINYLDIICSEYVIKILAGSVSKEFSTNDNYIAVEGKEIGNRKYFMYIGFSPLNAGARANMLNTEIWYFDKNKGTLEKFSQEQSEFRENCDYQEGKSWSEVCKEGFVLSEKDKDILGKIKSKIELYLEKNKFSSQLAYQKRNDKWKSIEKAIYDTKILDKPEKYVPITINANVKSNEKAPSKLTIFANNPKTDTKTKSIEVKIGGKYYGSLKDSDSFQQDLSGIKGTKDIEITVNNDKYQEEKFTISNVIFGS